MESNIDDNSKVGLSEVSEPTPNTEADSLNNTENILSNNDELVGAHESNDLLSNHCTNMDTTASVIDAIQTSCEEPHSADSEMANMCTEPNKNTVTAMDISIEEQSKELGTDQVQCEVEESELEENSTNKNIEQEADLNKCAITDMKTIEEADMDLQLEELNENNLETDKLRDSEPDDGIENGQEKPNKSASAFQRLASLGVISAEEPVVESKESLLQKLASRGSISITPSSGGAPTSLSSTSVKPTLPKQRPGSKSPVIKQKSKKIKIDSDKSSDIDEEFDSLISFLSAKNNSEELTESNTTLPTANDSENIHVQSKSENVSESHPEPKEDEENGVEEIANNDDAVHEMDNESHDESKVSHSSDQTEDDDRMLTSQPKNDVEEGSAEILILPKNVFYNKVQEFNRDMSIAALTVFSEMHQQDPRTRNKGKKRKTIDNNESDSSHAGEDVFVPGKKSENGITILEALSASGLRSIRYAREIPGVKEIIANDLSEDAVECIKKNVEHNRVEDLVTTARSDASFLMYQRQSAQQWYDAVDLDPYGCPSRFLDSAVQVVRDGGLLLVTCTDMAVLAGNSPESCHAKYGAISLRSPACHEMAIRIALQCIESHANRYGRYTVPLLCFSADFYIRVIIQVYTSPVTCKRTTSKLAMVFQCTGCQTFNFQPLGLVSQENANTQPKFSLAHAPPVNTNCFHCHHKHHMGGPIWTAPIYSSKFVESMLRVVENGRFGTAKRMQGMLEVIREELPDTPLYYTINGLCSRLHCQAIPLIDIRSAILNAGYRVSSSHAAPTAIKTNAPSKVIWDIMRCWVHMNPVSQKRLVVGSVPATIILEPPNLIANFDIHPKAKPSSSMRKLLRYQPNPEKNWGPGTRSRCNNSEDAKDEKRRLNQNKNKNKVQTKKTVEIIEVVTIDDEDEEVTEELKEPATE